MSELEKATYDRGFYNGIHEARQIFAKHLNVLTSTDEIKWDNVSKTDILSEIDNFMTKNESYPQPQLTIPKSIADEIDKFAHTNWANWQFYFYSDEMSKELIDWFDNGDSELTNSKIAMVYLNPLTRDLVKVVEG